MKGFTHGHAAFHVAVISFPLLFSTYPLRADPGLLDTSFDVGTATGTGCAAAPCGVYSIGLQPGGSMIVGGYFQISYGAARNFLARFGPNGLLDTNFNAKLAPSSGPAEVRAVILQPDGKIIIGGAFTNINGVTRNRIARLNDDGSLDQTFHATPGADGIVYAVASQADGKLLLGGSFTNVNGVFRSRLARLNSDGSLDTAFDPGTGANNTVWALALRIDGRVLVGGWFTTIDGTGQNRVARLNPDGSIDATFRPPSGIDSSSEMPVQVLTLAAQPDGKILVGGWFSSVNGRPCTGLVRLESDGTTDTNFDVSCLHSVPPNADVGRVNVLALQPDERIIVGGNFSRQLGAAEDGICRLNPDGSLDANFTPFGGYWVDAIATQLDGKVVAGGEFASFGGQPRYHMARLDGDPVLRAIVTGNKFVCSWPASYTNFMLQQTAGLNSPVQWATNPNPAVISAGQFVVTNLIDEVRTFYRLKR